MRRGQRVADYIGLFLALGVVAGSSGEALAQDSPAGEPKFTPTPSTAPAAMDNSNELLGPLERLPASAYPNSPIRGIEGGSLWMTFHGLQWPYYPKTGIGVSGYGWIDTGYAHLARGDANEESDKKMIQQGRVLLRVTPTWSTGSWFVQAQVELVGNQDQSQAQPLSSDTDDAWVRFGKWNLFDVQVGRYEAWEVYHFGMGLDLHTLERDGAVSFNGLPTPSIYGVSYAFLRPQSLGEGAFHLYPTKYLRFEVGTQFGNETAYNTYAVRPVGVLDFGWMKLKAGFEFRDLTPIKDDAKEDKKELGFGGALQFIIDPIVEFGLNFAQGNVTHTKNDGTSDDRGTNTTTSYGGFLNAQLIPQLLVGGGVDYTRVDDKQFDSMLGRYEDFDQWQVFGALQYRLWNQLFIKGVGGYALANYNPNNGSVPYKNETVSGRVRLMYLF
jgi:hypothetical protein